MNLVPMGSSPTTVNRPRPLPNYSKHEARSDTTPDSGKGGRGRRGDGVILSRVRSDTKRGERDEGREYLGKEEAIHRAKSPSGI